ncbi:MAG TPA: AsmA family protein [Stellaceae bacterium]|nr:AsmA family protein [Stellaceae bacterium]
MRRLVIVLAAGIGLAAAAVFVAPLVIPQSLVKAKLAALVRDRTGAALRIAGPVGLSLVPRLRLVADGVSLAAPPGDFSGEPLAADRVELSLGWLALLHGRLEVDRLALRHPVIRLEIDREGRRSWAFRRAAERQAGKPEAAAGSRWPLATLNLALADGEASYLDRRHGDRHTVHALDMTLSLPGPDGPLAASGSAAAGGDTVRFAATLAAPHALVDGGATPAVATLDAPRGTVEFAGRLFGKGELQAAGRLALKTPSLRRLVAWALPSAAPRAPSGGLALSAQAELAGGRLVLSGLQAQFDGTQASGTLTLAAGAERPAVTGRLAFDRLDLTHGSGRRASTAPPDPAPPHPASPSTDAAPSPDQASTAEPWSDRPFDLAALKLVDAELALTADAVRCRGVELGASRFALHLKGGWAELEGEAALYGGNATGKFVVDASGSAPAFAVSAQLTGITVRQLPVGIAGIETLGGTGNVYLLLSGRGGNPRELVGSLDGGGSLTLANGTIGAAGLAPLMRDSLGPAVGDKAIPRQVDYRTLAVTATIAHGILHSGDLKLDAAAMTATGAGTLDLTRRRIDYIWHPLIAGLGGARIAIAGDWADPLYKVQSVSITRGTLPFSGKVAVPGRSR